MKYRYFRSKHHFLQEKWLSVKKRSLAAQSISSLLISSLSMSVKAHTTLAIIGCLTII